MKTGFTLPEILLGLVIAAVLLHLGVGPTRTLLDRWAVHAAREEVVGLLVLGRARALGTTGARVRFDEVDGAVVVDSEAWPDSVVRPRERHGVHLEVVGAARSVTLEWDGLGLGKVASRRIRFRRAGATADLVLSASGRLRRVGP